MVVHGVGDPCPGETLSLFARSLAEPDRPLHEHQDVIWLADRPDRPDDETKVKTFPVHRRRVEFEGQSIEMCETFWGDLSRVRRGWIGLIRGLFQIIFGLRYVAYVAADQPGVAAFWLKRLGLMSARILHGPVLAVTFYLGILIVAVCGTHLMWPASYRSDIWTQVVLVGCAIVALGASAIGHRMTHSRVIDRFWFWVAITAVFITALMLFRSFCVDRWYPGLFHECPIHPGLLWYCRVLLVFLGLLWFIEMQVIVAMACCWLVSLRHSRAYRPALHIAFLLPAMAIGVWGQVLPMVWLTAKQGVLILAKHLHDGTADAPVAAVVSGDIDLAHHSHDATVGDSLPLQTVSDSDILNPEFAEVFDDAIPFLGVQMMMMAVLLCAAVVVLARYFRWRQRFGMEEFVQGKRAPRLIVSGWLQIAMAACTMVGVVLVSVLWAIQVSSADYTEYWFGRLMMEANKYAVSILVPLGGLMFFLVPRLRPAFDMLLDVVNHFYFRPTHARNVMEDEDEFDIAETTFENGAMFFSRRDSLHSRLKKILSHYREAYDHCPELVIVSHSQGTMIAIEVLNDDEVSWINSHFRSVTLVTMGSPLTHLYQHYFGHYYPGLDQPFWASLRRRVDRWINICRIDDFVGTELDLPGMQDNPNTEAASRPTRLTVPREKLDRSFYSPPQFENFAVGPRGHQGYWEDLEVLEILRRELFEIDAELAQPKRAA